VYINQAIDDITGIVYANF